MASIIDVRSSGNHKAGFDCEGGTLSGQQTMDRTDLTRFRKWAVCWSITIAFCAVGTIALFALGPLIKCTVAHCEVTDHSHGQGLAKAAFVLPNVRSLPRPSHPRIVKLSTPPRGILPSMTSVISAPIADGLQRDVPLIRDHQTEEPVNILALNEEELQGLMKQWGFPSFRGTQIYKFLYERGVSNFEDMHNLPKLLRAALTERATMGVLTKSIEQVSKDGTAKRAYALSDGKLIESVLMPYNDGRRTACISSQVGCAMGCTFCATGQMGFARHLSAAEIFEQAARYSSELKAKGERLSNVVFMGMGEPLANYDNVMKAVERINRELGIGSRHITISTVGLAPEIRKLASEKLQLTLAVSLHESDDDARSKLMPINRRFPLHDVLDACRMYQATTGRRITFEWALISGKNDKPQVARELGQLLQGIMCHVNIIPLNPTQGSNFRPASTHAMDGFIKVLAEYGVQATPRVRRGLDIDAGCGQLTQKLAGEKRSM